MSYKDHRLYGWLSEVRRDLHMHPETAFEEVRTTAKIKDILGSLGIPLVELDEPPRPAAKTSLFLCKRSPDPSCGWAALIMKRVWTTRCIRPITTWMKKPWPWGWRCSNRPCAII